MMKRGAWMSLLLAVLVAPVLAQTPPLTIKSDALPTGAAGSPYTFSFVADGGTKPYAWTVREGSLPAGLNLDSKSGAIAGAPAEAGEYRFTVGLADSGVPRNEVQRKYTLVIVAALTIEWIDPPRIDGQGIRGRLRVSNQTGRPFDQTVVVLAVNEVGKAFALGYQHFTLKPGTKSPPIPFESTLPDGDYVVHADAVAEVPAINTIYRARLQTANPMLIRQP